METWLTTSGDLWKPVETPRNPWRHLNTPGDGARDIARGNYDPHDLSLVRLFKSNQLYLSTRRASERSVEVAMGLNRFPKVSRGLERGRQRRRKVASEVSRELSTGRHGSPWVSTGLQENHTVRFSIDLIPAYGLHYSTQLYISTQPDIHCIPRSIGLSSRPNTHRHVSSKPLFRHNPKPH